MPRAMNFRLRFLFIALICGWCGAALEIGEVAAARPWIGSCFARAAIEIAALWSAATLALALVALLFRRRSSPEGAFLIAPLAWGVAWLLAAIDARGRIETAELLLIGACLLLVGLAAGARLAPALARVRLSSSPWPWLVVLVAALGAAGWRWRATTPRRGAAAARATPSVLWISLDTVRADRVGAFGGAAGLTPSLDALAREAVVFADVTAPMPLTAPSHTAMLTGLMPHESRVERNGVPLPRSTQSLPRLLAEAGYDTAAFVSGFPLLERTSHLACHFHHYDDEFDPHAPLSEGARLTPFGVLAMKALHRVTPWTEPLEREADRTVDRAIEWLDGTTSDAAGARPFFAFCHLYDAHGEYLPHRPGETRSRFWSTDSARERLALLEDEGERRHVAELYDGEVRFVDAQVGRLLDRLRARGGLDRTLVVVTADHGESLGEHDLWYEHISPYHVETHVPLIVRLPGAEKAGTRVLGPAQLTDLPATVRDLLGLSFDLPSASLAGSIESGRIPRRVICCQSLFDFDDGWHSVSARDGRFKLMRVSAAFERFDSRRLPSAERLFDLDSDPGELHDLLAAGGAPEEARVDELCARLDEYEKACVAIGPQSLDPEVAANLRRLGYGH